MRVLQVRAGVALEGEHPVPVEHVVLNAFGGQVGVLQGSDTDHVGHDEPLLGHDVGVLLSDRGCGALDRLIEQVGELDRVAGPAAHHLSVLAQHIAEPDVHRFGRLRQPASHSTHLEHHLQVLCLRCSDDIQHQIGVEPLDTIDHTRQVAGRIHERTGLGLRNHRKWVTIAILEARWIHHHCAGVFVQQAGGLESSVHTFHQWLVTTLPRQIVVGEEDIKLGVHPVEVGVGHLDKATPQHQRCFVAPLQQHHPGPGALLKFFRVLELRIGLFVEAIEIALRQPVARHVLAEVKQVFDEHAERPAPVADVVLADHCVPEKLVEPNERVTDHGRTQVADVHLLRDVRRRVVDDHDLRVGGRLDAKPAVADHCCEL